MDNKDFKEYYSADVATKDYAEVVANHLHFHRNLQDTKLALSSNLQQQVRFTSSKANLSPLIAELLKTLEIQDSVISTNSELI